MTMPANETWYMWKRYATCGDEEAPRLLTPWADPNVYEMQMDLMFNTAEEALEYKLQDGAAMVEDWYLVKVTFEVQSRQCPPEESDEFEV